MDTELRQEERGVGGRESGCETRERSRQTGFQGEEAETCSDVLLVATSLICFGLQVPFVGTPVQDCLALLFYSMH